MKLPKKFFDHHQQNFVPLTSLYFNQEIQAYRNCPVSSVLLLEASQVINLANGVYRLISFNPTMELKGDSTTNEKGVPLLNRWRVEDKHTYFICTPSYKYL